MRIVLTESTRLGFAADSLAGLSVGDALGAQYFMVGRKVEDLIAGVAPPPVWEWTDDTEMACSVVWMLAEAGRVDPAVLAGAFAHRCEPNRGYGVGAFTVLRQIRQGMPWPEAAAAAFGGQGSAGWSRPVRGRPAAPVHCGQSNGRTDSAVAVWRFRHGRRRAIPIGSRWWSAWRGRGR